MKIIKAHTKIITNVYLDKIDYDKLNTVFHCDDKN